MTLAAAFDRVAGRRLILFGGKGGVGKTTVSIAAALHLAKSRPVILFTTDPASNLSDILHGELRTESVDSAALYQRFLDRNLESFLELGDRGTYLDKDELRRFFELSLPGVDELMAWMRIGELVEENPEATIVVDTAPTGHTLRMLSSADHFRQFAEALDSMQAKHRGMVRQFTRRDVRDAMDVFIDQFEADASRRRDLLTNPAHAAFVPVTLSEQWVVEQTERLIRDVRADGIDVPFVILNRAVVDDDCDRSRDDAARKRLAPVVDAPRACAPLDTADTISEWTAWERGRPARLGRKTAGKMPALPASLQLARLTFLAGKGGVGKTTSAASIALQLAAQHPDKNYTVISVDPAHTLRDVFTNETPPKNLTVETIDTRAKWRRFRDNLGEEIDRAIGAITPGGMTVAYDADAMKKLVEIAPPGADELFAITRLADLIADDSQSAIIVDTAPTGHFLRLIDLPATAGEWVREFMRILLRYRELIPAGSLGEELIRASKALHALEEAMRSDSTRVIVVTRPERIVIAESKRLIAEVERRGMRLGGVIANYVTPENDCACDQSLRGFEMDALADLGRDDVVIIERRDQSVTKVSELATLVPS
ncbi:MAG TPA: ArsA family ATPase [Thermoanaerobaculia bacterium]|nr:ArsA family ATPase [Thermoanaerobaculia bacterium]